MPLSTHTEKHGEQAARIALRPLANTCPQLPGKILSIQPDNSKSGVAETVHFGFNSIVQEAELCNQQTITNLRLRLLSSTKLVILIHGTRFEARPNRACPKAFL